jgi:hypothetical protein
MRHGSELLVSHQEVRLVIAVQAVGRDHGHHVAFRGGCASFAIRPVHPV